uniref:Ubiquitin-like protease family profile domain-containing protein n=1 Tax=Chenopodium quinoa TaxID=63459 RepID=A0A803L0Z6_CHEQI
MKKLMKYLVYEFDEVKFERKTPKYTLDCGVFTMMHMLCFTRDPFDYDLDLANRRKVYRAEICAALALAEINTERKSLVEKVSRFIVVRKLEQDKEVKDMIYVSDFLKTHKEVMQNMSLKCKQVIDYLSINVDENFPNKRQKERSENDMVRFFFGRDFMDALTMRLNAHGKKGVTSLQKLWIDWTKSQSLDLDAAECVFIPLKQENYYFLAVINFKNETIDHLDNTLYESTDEYEHVQSFILETIIQMQKLFKKRKHPKAIEMLSYKLRIIELPFQKQTQENYSGSYLMLHMKVYDGINGIGLGTIKEEFQRLTHHHIKTVLNLLLNDNNQMQEKLLTNVKDWEEKKAQKACVEERI